MFNIHNKNKYKLAHFHKD